MSLYHSTKPHLPKIALGVFLVLYLVMGLYTELKLIEIKPLPQYLLEDFSYYQQAVIKARQGQDPYDVRSIGTGFLYPPPALLIVDIFYAITPFLFRASIYIITNIILAGWMTYGIARHFGYSLKDVWYWFPLILGFGPFLELLHIGQINMITQFGIFLLFLAETAYPALAGFGLGLAITTKVTPLLFLGYLIIQKRYKVIALTLAAILFLCFLGWLRYGPAPFPKYLIVFQDLLHQFPLNQNSQSLAAKLIGRDSELKTLALFLLPGWQSSISQLFAAFASHVELFQKILVAYVGLLLVLSGLATWFLKQREPFFIVVSLGMLLTPNILWYHHYVFMLLPLLIWMGWKRLKPPVVIWCLAGLFLTQVDRWHISYGLLIHLFGHLSMLGIVIQQLRDLTRHIRQKALPQPAPDPASPTTTVTVTP